MAEQFLQVCQSIASADEHGCTEALVAQLHGHLVSECGPLDSPVPTTVIAPTVEEAVAPEDLCAPNSRPLVQSTLVNGWGNVLGRWLTHAAVARSLGAAHVARFPKLDATLHGGMDFAEFVRVVRLPCNLRILGDVSRVAGDRVRLSLEAAGSLAIGQQSNLWAGVNNYLPETAWTLWQGVCGLGEGLPRRVCAPVAPRWSNGQHWPAEPAKASPYNASAKSSAEPRVTRAQFLAHYRAVQLGLQPKVDLCLPPPRSYLALHVRRRNRRTEHRAPTADDNDAAFAAQLKQLQAVIGNDLRHHLSSTSSSDVDKNGNVKHSNGTWVLPWVVVGDSTSAVQDATALLESLGATVLAAHLGHCSSSSSSSSSSSVEGRELNFEDETGEGLAAQAAQDPDFVMAAAMSGDAAAVKRNTYSALRDFFMIKGAAGLVPLVPSFAESSFSTVAASSGQVPILFAYRRAEHLDALPVWYEREGNFGQPIHGFFFAEHVRAFARAVVDPGFGARPSAAAENSPAVDPATIRLGPSPIGGTTGELAGAGATEQRQPILDAAASTTTPPPLPLLPHIPWTWAALREQLPRTDLSAAEQLLPSLAALPLLHLARFNRRLVLFMTWGYAALDYDLRAVASPAEALERIFHVAVLQQCADALQTTHEIEARRDASAAQAPLLEDFSGVNATAVGAVGDNTPLKRELPILTSRRLMLAHCQDAQAFKNMAVVVMGAVVAEVAETVWNLGL